MSKAVYRRERRDASALGAVQRLVLPGRTVPGVVPRHRPLLRGAPGALVAPEHERPIERLQQGSRRLLLEAEAPPLRPLGDAVVEPSDRVDQRKRPVAQREELVQPAGLAPRGNDESAGARLAPVGQSVAEAELRRSPPGMAGGTRRALLFQRGVPGAELHHL